MAAFGDVSLAYAEKKGRATAITNSEAVYARTFTFTTQVSDTVAGPIDITGLTLPPGTSFLGGVVKPTKTSDGTILSTGSTTLAFKTKTAGIVFSAATAYTTELAMPASVPMCVPSTATANDIIQVTTASATLPAYAMTFYVTLYLANFGQEVTEYATFSV